MEAGICLGRDWPQRQRDPGLPREESSTPNGGFQYKTANDYANIIMALNTKNAENPDAGYLPEKRVGKDMEHEHGSNQQRLAQLVRNEIMTIKTYRVKTPTRGLYPTPHYKLT
jgi:hypothetical protein